MRACIRSSSATTGGSTQGEGILRARTARLKSCVSILAWKLSEIALLGLVGMQKYVYVYSI